MAKLTISAMTHEGNQIEILADELRPDSVKVLINDQSIPGLNFVSFIATIEHAFLNLNFSSVKGWDELLQSVKNHVGEAK